MSFSPLQKQLELFVCRWWRRRRAHIQRGLDKQCPLGLRLQRPFVTVVCNTARVRLSRWLFVFRPDVD